MPYLLDTDIVSALQHNHPAVVGHLAAASPAEIFVSIVTCEEHVAGRLHSLHGQLSAARLVEAYQRLQQTLGFYATVNILPFDQAAASRDEELRLRYRRMGTKDRRIAAIAMVNQCTLVTRNTVHFQSIAGLALANWIDTPYCRCASSPAPSASSFFTVFRLVPVCRAISRTEQPCLAKTCRSVHPLLHAQHPQGSFLARPFVPLQEPIVRHDPPLDHVSRLFLAILSRLLRVSNSKQSLSA